MTIDREKLISLLVEKTEQDRRQIENQLAELITRIQKAAGEGKTFEIEGFGIFTMEDGVLHFEPNQRLETEINNRYAGMKPIELIGAFKEPDGRDIPAVSAGTPAAEEDDDIWGIKKESGPETEEPEAEDEPASVSPPREQEEKTHSEEPAEAVTAPIPEPRQTTTTQKEDSAEPVFGKPEVKSTRIEKKRRGSSPVTEKQDPIGRFLIAAVVILSVGIGGWFVYDFGLLGNADSSPADQAAVSSPNVNRQEQLQVTNDNQGSESDPSAGLTEEELNTADAVTNNADEERDLGDSSNDDTPYGLHGTFNTSITGGYTIVVHSLRRQQQAAAMQERLNDDGYRTVITEAAINGQTYYRVGIGQFESVSSAQEAVGELPDSFRDNHFIRRI